MAVWAQRSIAPLPSQIHVDDVGKHVLPSASGGFYWPARKSAL